MSAHVVVLGAGPGGYPAAFHAADLGLKVTLVDSEATPGGVCLHRGCIPSKALLHAAGAIVAAREAAEFGITFAPAEISVEKLRAWKQSVVGKLTGGLGQLRKQRGVDYIQGRGKLAGARSLEVTTPDGARQTLAFDYAILATGSSPARVPAFPASARVMDSTGALALEDIPPRLLVVGGGYIGLELGQAYAALGSRVTVVEMLPALLANADADLVRILQARLRKQFAAILLDTRVADMRDTGAGVSVTFMDKAGATTTTDFDRVLVSVGRKPNTADAGIETTAAVVGRDGFVQVDPQRRTAEPTIFAVGDIAGQPMLAHKATHEGKIAAEAIAGRKTAWDARCVPAVVFTDPEIAWCGLTESEARQRGVEVKVGKFPWGASGRATTLGRSDGLSKVIADPGTERVLGVAIAGPGAGELIAEGALAVEMGATVADLALTIHAHPTLSETVMEAAEAFHGASTHFAR